jgi:hypothetical protein
MLVTLVFEVFLTEIQQKFIGFQQSIQLCKPCFVSIYSAKIKMYKSFDMNKAVPTL